MPWASLALGLAWGFWVPEAGGRFLQGSSKINELMPWTSEVTLTSLSYQDGLLQLSGNFHTGDQCLSTTYSQ